MTAEPEPKTIKRSVSFQAKVLESSQAIADRNYAGNLSRYVNDTLQQAQAGRAAVGADAILSLVRAYDPSAEMDFAELLGASERSGIDQRVVVKRFLDALRKALAAGLDPEWPFDLVSSTARTQREPEVITLLRDIKTQLEAGGGYTLAESPPAAPTRPRRP